MREEKTKPGLGVIEALFELAVEAVETFSYLGVLITMALESACVPIPSEVVMPLAGYALCDTPLDVVLIALLAAAANLAGSLAAYVVGARFGEPLLEKLERKPVFSGEIRRCKELFSRYGEVAVGISRVLPGVRTFISLPAGAMRVELKRFVALTFLCSVPWNLALAYTGFVMRENWALVGRYMAYLDYAVLALLLAAITLFFVGPRLRRARAARHAGSMNKLTLRQ